MAITGNLSRQQIALECFLWLLMAFCILHNFYIYRKSTLCILMPLFYDQCVLRLSMFLNYDEVQCTVCVSMFSTKIRQFMLLTMLRLSTN